MTRREYKIAIVTGIFSLLVASLIATRGDGQQSAMLRPLDAQSPISYFIADGNGAPGYRSSDRQLALWALQAWQRTSPNRLQFEAVEESKALVRLYWAGPEGGQFGEMRPLTVGDRPGAAVFIRPDMESFGPEIAERAGADDLWRDTIVYLTCLHELGHAMGLAHTRDFDDIMFYFGYGGDVVEYFGRYRARLHNRSDIATTSGLSAADIGRMKAMYGSK